MMILDICSTDFQSALQVYHVDMEEVLARLRFPQYLEHVQAAFGEKARQGLQGRWDVEVVAIET